uniref:Transposase Tc1-like domain-containing protein n=1 Tax=Nothobranchius furzeri TaxID=105023 RepID=A0A8C6KZI1_NOTFU
MKFKLTSIQQHLNLTVHIRCVQQTGDHKRALLNKKSPSHFMLSKIISLHKKEEVTVSRDNIRRTLQRNGMHGYRPRKKSLLAHLGLARAHAGKDEDYWVSRLWRDKIKITGFGTNGF